MHLKVKMLPVTNKGKMKEIASNRKMRYKHPKVEHLENTLRVYPHRASAAPAASAANASLW